MIERAKWDPHNCLTVDSCTDYASIESYNGLGKKRPLRSRSSNPPVMDRVTFHWIRLLKDPSSLALEYSRDWACTTLGNLFLCLTTPTVEYFFLTSNLLSLSLKPIPLVLLLHDIVRSPSPPLS